MAGITRLTPDGYGGRTAGSFAGKPAYTPGTKIWTQDFTRFGLEGYGVRRAGSFAGKSIPDTGVSEWIIKARRRGRR